MTVTLTAGYKETLKPDTVTKLQELCGEDGETGAYYLKDALIFIDEYSESDFVEYYEEYIELGEEHTFDAVDSYLTLYDMDELTHFEDKFIGEYSSDEAMAEDYFSDETYSLSSMISIDWEDTAERLLNHDVDKVGSFYFRCY